MDNNDYRRLHESFMLNHRGTSIWENFIIIAPVPILVYFVGLSNFYIEQFQCSIFRKQTLLFFTEFFVIVFMVILNLTILSSHCHLVIIFILFMYIVFCLKLCWKKANQSFLYSSRKKQERRPYFTYFKSIISLMTCICILAVDFHIFPRRLAKTETFGYGLMDTGVGFYIAANGIVHKPKNHRNTFSKALLNSLPIVLLGVVRYASLAKLDYQKHVTEYGIHWNFFFTLAIVKLLATFLINNFPDRLLVMAVTTAIFQQVLISSFAERWVLDESLRSNIIDANKEGIVSLFGYLSLYMCSAATGKFLNKPAVRLVDDLRHGLKTLIWTIIFLLLTLIFENMFNVSRRLANLTYVSWMLTMTLFSISLSIFVEVSLRLTFSIKDEKQEMLTPNILEAINSNSLFYFLLSNIFTGMINMMFQTFHIDPFFSIVILISYQLGSCGILYVMHLFKIKLKFW